MWIIFQRLFDLAEVEGVGPDMDEAVEGDEDEEHDQDGHHHLVNSLSINLITS